MEETEHKTQPVENEAATGKSNMNEHVRGPVKKTKKIVGIVVLVIVLLALVIGAIFGYRYYKQKLAKQKASQETIQSQVIKSTEPVEGQLLFTK